ncbi:integrase [Photobacterium sp. ZSDE20]|nr:integrase [Photobacterium sp. ZSDE20]
MLAFDNSQDLELALDVMCSLGGSEDYLKSMLFPALLRGKWEELDKMIVYKDEKKTILFGEDMWGFRESLFKGKGAANFYFDIDFGQGKNVIMLHNKERHLVNQMKCVVVAYMWFSAKPIELASIKNKVNDLRKDITKLINRDITSFEELDQEHLDILVDDGCFDLSKSQPFRGLNALPALKGLLPFNVNFPNLTHRMFNVRREEGEGKLVIPPRIYFAALTEYSDDIVKAYRLRDEIEQAVESMISFYENELKNKLLQIRNGGSYSPCKDYKNNWEKFTRVLAKKGVPLVDRGEDPRWMKIFSSLETRIRLRESTLSRFNTCIDGISYGWGDLKRYVFALNAKAGWLCLALTGMRIDELYKISPVYGAQKKTFDKNGSESDEGKETIYFLTTRQSKITLNSQTKNDVFVTTESGWKAFHVLNAIHTPYRQRFEERDSHRMFANLARVIYSTPVGKSGLGKSIKDKFNKENFDFVLSVEDMGYLQTSDPEQTSLKKGDKFYFTPHQTRRSLAYYLVGYELCSFPALKQQLSHLSMAMTRWYARNAHSFEQLYSEIKKERITQKAEIFARIYKKMANGERIAGGKGQAMIAEISREGESYFEDGVNKRKLSVEYWIEQLTNGKAHLHAVAPSMYCTNTQCSMRINIDLVECVDCEYDYIENAVYAESSRMDAMRNIEFLKECNDLNSSSATKYFMQVKAAEAILDDLEFKHDKYDFSEDVMKLVIETTQVA